MRRSPGRNTARARKRYGKTRNYAEVPLHEELAAQQQAAELRPGLQADQWLLAELRFAGHGCNARGRPSRRWCRDLAKRHNPGVEDHIVAKRKIVHFGQVFAQSHTLSRSSTWSTRSPACRAAAASSPPARPTSATASASALDRPGAAGQVPDAAASLEVLDKAEAQQIFRQYDEEGLMHSIWTGVTPVCGGPVQLRPRLRAYKGYIEERGCADFFRAEYICQVDWDLCTGCKSWSMSQCQFGAAILLVRAGKGVHRPHPLFWRPAGPACPHEATASPPAVRSAEAASIWLRAG